MFNCKDKESIPPTAEQTATGRLTANKRRTSRMADILRLSGYGDKADKLDRCGDIVYRDERGKIIGGWFCHDAICPICSWGRMAKIRAELAEVIDYIGTDDYSFYLISLTYPNCRVEELKASTEAIYAAFAQLRRRDVWNGRIKGCLWTYEVTYNPSTGMYHPHLHIVAVTYRNADIDARMIFRSWRDCCGRDLSEDAFSVKRIRPTEKNQTEKDNLLHVIDYVCKGVLGKTSDIDALLHLDGRNVGDALMTISDAIRGKRRFQFCGLLKEVRHTLDMEDDDELPDAADMETLKRSAMGREIFRLKWDGVTRRYGVTVV